MSERTEESMFSIKKSIEVSQLINIHSPTGPEHMKRGSRMSMKKKSQRLGAQSQKEKEVSTQQGSTLGTSTAAYPENCLPSSSFLCSNRKVIEQIEQLKNINTNTNRHLSSRKSLKTAALPFSNPISPTGFNPIPSIPGGFPSPEGELPSIHGPKVGAVSTLNTSSKMHHGVKDNRLLSRGGMTNLQMYESNKVEKNGEISSPVAVRPLLNSPHRQVSSTVKSQQQKKSSLQTKNESKRNSNVTNGGPLTMADGKKYMICDYRPLQLPDQMLRSYSQPRECQINFPKKAIFKKLGYVGSPEGKLNTNNLLPSTLDHQDKILHGKSRFTERTLSTNQINTNVYRKKISLNLKINELRPPDEDTAYLEVPSSRTERIRKLDSIVFSGVGVTPTTEAPQSTVLSKKQESEVLEGEGALPVKIGRNNTNTRSFSSEEQCLVQQCNSSLKKSILEKSRLEPLGGRIFERQGSLEFEGTTLSNSSKETLTPVSRVKSNAHLLPGTSSKFGGRVQLQKIQSQGSLDFYNLNASKVKDKVGAQIHFANKVFEGTTASSTISKAEEEYSKSKSPDNNTTSTGVLIKNKNNITSVKKILNSSKGYIPHTPKNQSICEQSACQALGCEVVGRAATLLVLSVMNGVYIINGYLLNIYYVGKVICIIISDVTDNTHTTIHYIDYRVNSIHETHKAMGLTHSLPWG